MNDKKRFLKYVDKTKSCWIWTGAKSKFGYGLFWYSKSEKAHRAAYEIFIEKIPKGMFVCHTCDVKKCVNPKHLWLGTNKDNMQDAVRKGRHFNQKKKFCPKGHEYTMKSFCIRREIGKEPKIRRDCRVCRIRINKEYYDRIKKRFDGAGSE